MKHSIAIRSMTADDLPEIAETHVRVWQQAYPGQMPQDFLDKLDPAVRLKAWREGFEKNKNDSRFGTLLACTPESVAGFLCYGPARDDDRSNWMEIYSINILKEHWSKGIGYKLYTLACNILKEKGVRQTYLWVLDTNHNALHAYHRWGGVMEKVRTKNISIGGQALKEVSILFDIS